MGVRVRLSRNTSAYLPFWAAIPAWLGVAAVWLIVLTIWGLVMLFVLAVKGIAALARRHQGAGS
jgi:hypothetical protein